MALGDDFARFGQALGTAISSGPQAEFEALRKGREMERQEYDPNAMLMEIGGRLAKEKDPKKRAAMQKQFNTIGNVVADINDFKHRYIARNKDRAAKDSNWIPTEAKIKEFQVGDLYNDLTKNQLDIPEASSGPWYTFGFGGDSEEEIREKDDTWKRNSYATFKKWASQKYPGMDPDMVATEVQNRMLSVSRSMGEDVDWNVDGLKVTVDYGKLGPKGAVVPRPPYKPKRQRGGGAPTGSGRGKSLSMKMIKRIAKDRGMSEKAVMKEAKSQGYKIVK